MLFTSIQQEEEEESEELELKLNESTIKMNSLFV